MERPAKGILFYPPSSGRLLGGWCFLPLLFSQSPSGRERASSGGTVLLPKGNAILGHTLLGSPEKLEPVHAGEDRSRTGSPSALHSTPLHPTPGMCSWRSGHGSAPLGEVLIPNCPAKVLHHPQPDGNTERPAPVKPCSRGCRALSGSGGAQAPQRLQAAARAAPFALVAAVGGNVTSGDHSRRAGTSTCTTDWFLTDFSGFFAVQPCSLGVPGFRGRRWNQRKLARPDVTTGTTFARSLALEFTAFGENPHFHVGIGRRGSENAGWDLRTPYPPPLSVPRVGIFDSRTQRNALKGSRDSRWKAGLQGVWK
eukprot:gene24255-biopygen8926